MSEVPAQVSSTRGDFTHNSRTRYQAFEQATNNRAMELTTKLEDQY